MVNDKETSSQQQQQQQVKAPTYNELMMLIGELRERLQVAEKAAEQTKVAMRRLRARVRVNATRFACSQIQTTP